MIKNELLQKINMISTAGFRFNSLVWWSTPVSSKNRFYEPLSQLFNGKSIRYHKIFFQNFYVLIKHVISTLVRILVSKFTQSAELKNIEKRLNGKVTIVKTFGYGSYNNFSDPFFGSLKDSLNEEVLTLFEPVNSFKESLEKKSSKQNLVSIYDYMRIQDILNVFWKIFYSLLSNYFRRNEGASNTTKQDTEIKKLYLVEHLSPTTFHAMTFYFVMKNIIKKYDVSKYIYTYENNPWERASLLALEGEDIRTIGYQHNVIPLASLNMFLGKDEESFSPVPDYIFTTGSETKLLLEEYSSFPVERIVTTCALRYKYLDSLKPYSRNGEKKLLVALEGVWQAADIVNYLLSSMDNFKDWEITFRFHPALPYHQMKKEFRSNLEEIPNVKISSGTSLADDVKSSYCVLYWGSTVGLESVLQGRPVINISMSKINYDPMFNLTSFKRTWDVDTGNISNILENLYTMDREDYENEFRVAQEYLNRYFHKCSNENMKPFGD